MKERVLFVRPAAGAPERWVDPVRRALQTTEPDLPFADVRVMRTLLDHEVRPWRLGATMFGVFGALALVLTALGLYSVIAFAVVQRTHEMGIRVALGAGRASIVRLVVRQGVVAALVGSVIGVAVAAGAARFVASLLFHESPRDPAVFVSVGAVLLAVAVLASAVPAWRASRVDPMVALRAD